MGANPKQALGFLVFLIAFTLIAGAFFTGGNLLLFVAGLALLAVSLMILLKAKPLEHIEG